MSDDILNTVYQVGQFFVSDIYSFYQDTYKGNMGKVQIEVLDLLHSKESVSASEIAEKLNISKQHASKIAVKLESIGFAGKKTDPNDRRGTRYFLTDAGKEFISSHILRSNNHFLSYLNSLDQEDRAKLINALNDMYDVIDRNPMN